MSSLPIIVIGAGLAGWTTIREFRKLDTTTPVLLVTADSGDFYAKPTLSNAFAQGRLPAQLVTTPAASMAQTLNVTLLPHTRVTAIDPTAHQISTDLGKHPYRQLVMATGAQPIRVPLAGDAADLVQTINSLDDFAAFHQRLQGVAKAQVLIMGAGLIGCEFANDLAVGGHAVTVVDPGTRPLAALLPPAASAQLQAALSGLGVQWHFGSTATAVNHAPATDGEQGTARLQVSLSNGQSAQVDTVLSAIGLRADTRLAHAAGLLCERGVVVDAQLQTSAPDVYALGDGAQYAAAGNVTLPFVMPIMHAAKVLAARLAGQDSALVFPLMPVAIKTPALPITVALAAAGLDGGWHEGEPGMWHFRDTQAQQRGFVLTGGQTKHRMAQSKLTVL
jgi:rubredoxin-NAD+ reductase